MAIITLNKEELKKLLGKIDDSKIDEILSLFSAAVEEMDDKEVQVEVAPNRPDMLSQQGLLRALSSFLGKKTGLKQYKINKPEPNYEVIVDKSVLEVRPYTACAIIKNIKFDDEKINGK